MVDEERSAPASKRRGKISRLLKICWSIVLYSLAIWGVYNLAAHTTPEVQRCISAKHTSLAQSHQIGSTPTSIPVVELQYVQPEPEPQHHRQAKLDPAEEAKHAELNHEHHAVKEPTHHHSADSEQHAHHQQTPRYREDYQRYELAEEGPFAAGPGISGKRPRAASVGQTNDHGEHEVRTGTLSTLKPGIKPKRP